MDNYYNREFKKYLEKEKEARRIPFDEEICKAPPTAEVPSCGHGREGAALQPPSPVDVSPPAPLPASTNDASRARNDAEKLTDAPSNMDDRLQRQLEDKDTCPTETYVLQTLKHTDEL